MSRITLSSKAEQLIKTFQREDATRQIPVGSAVLGHKTGMGKTLIALASWAGWHFRKAFILGSVSSTSVWLKQPDVWTTGIPIEFLEAGSPDLDTRFQAALKAREGVFMATYQTYERYARALPKRPQTDLLVCDELHKIRNRTAARTKAAMRFEFEHFIGLSATWASRGVQDLWTIMNMLEPQYWGSYWKWVNTWCITDDGAFGGKDIIGLKPGALPNLRKYMDRYYRTRSWKEVGIEFPPTIRQPIMLRLSRTQRKMHDDMVATMLTTASGALVVAPSSLAQILRLRQICVSPRLVDRYASDRGSAIDYVLDQVEEDPHTVIFSPFAEVLPIIEQELRDEGYNDIYTFRGGLAPAEVNRREDLFKRTKGIALVSIAFAESFALDTTNLAHFLGFEWDPNLNIQAEGRLRRLDSELIHTPVYARYTMHADTIEDHQKYVVNDKVRTVRALFPDMTTDSEAVQEYSLAGDQQNPLDFA